MQIKQILIYGLDGQVRPIDLRLNALNIITGEKGTGKSSLIHIVDWCLASGSCRIAEGVVKYVGWFAVRLHFRDGEVFVARRSPILGRGEFYVDFGANNPSFAALKPNIDFDSLKFLVGGKLGISENLHVPGPGFTRAPLSANIRHALFYSFQPQEDILSPTYLFRGSNDRDKKQAIKDTLPYFLGAVSEDSLAIRGSLQEARRELSFAKKNLRDIKMASGAGGSIRVFSLLAEAAQAGLLPESESENREEVAVIEMLEAAAKWSPSASVEEIPGGKRGILEAERRDLLAKYKLAKMKLDEFQRYASSRSGAGKQIGERQARLSSIDLFPIAADDAHCPLCNSKTTVASGPAAVVRERLIAVSSELGELEEHKVRIQERLDELAVRLSDIKEQLATNQSGLEALAQTDAEEGRLSSIDAERGRVVGRISMFLESYRPSDEKADAEQKVAQAENRVEALERILDDDEASEKTAWALGQISRDMKRWASELQLEYSEWPLRLDAKHLTVFADTDDGPLALQSFGSATNWVGYHLVAHLALHGFFLKHRRPVPSFVFFDQPSGTYFLPETPGADPKNAEKQAVRQMFSWMHETVLREMSPGFQVILTEHADENAPWFQSSIVERWRDGRALIPQSWRGS